MKAKHLLSFQVFIIEIWGIFLKKLLSDLCIYQGYFARSLKCELEDIILKKIKNLDPIQKAEFNREVET